MSNMNPKTVTRLLHDWRKGDENALGALMPLVYEELRGMAGQLMRSERKEHTLQATALVHDAYIRLMGSEGDIGNRAHFLALAAQVMRRILVDHARARRAAKRHGDQVRVTLSEVDVVVPGSADKVIEIHDAMEKLKELDPRKQRALELRIFGGLTHADIAEVLEVSVPTVERDLRMAQAWLRGELR